MSITEERRRELMNQMAANPALRREIKELTANRRRVIAKSTGDARRARPFPEEVFQAAARSIADGMTIPRIAAQIWCRHGYSSQEVAENALRNGLRRRGLYDAQGSARLA